MSLPTIWAYRTFRHHLVAVVPHTQRHRQAPVQIGISHGEQQKKKKKREEKKDKRKTGTETETDGVAEDRRVSAYVARGIRLMPEPESTLTVCVSTSIRFSC